MSRHSGSARLSQRFAIARVATLCLALLGTASLASADAQLDEATIGYRQKLMSAIGANMGAIGDIMKNQLDLPGHVASHSKQMAESADLIAAAFRKPVSQGKTDAKPAIWKEWSDFEKAIADLRKASLTLEQAATSGDSAAVGPAVKALGKACGGCHKPFRKPKEESYKNQ